MLCRSPMCNSPIQSLKGFNAEAESEADESLWYLLLLKTLNRLPG